MKTTTSLVDVAIQGKINRATAWIGYCRLLPDIIGYFPYSLKIYELPDGKNVWK